MFLIKIGHLCLKCEHLPSPLFSLFSVEKSEIDDLLMTLTFSPDLQRYRCDTIKRTCTIPIRYQGQVETINEMVKKSITSIVLEHERGFVFHSSFLVGKRDSILITGVSGAGKSTLTRKLTPFFRCGNDDLNLVHPHDGQLDAHSTPFYNWQKAQEAGLPFPLSAPVSKVFFLEKEYSGPSSLYPIHDKDLAWHYLIDNHLIFFPEWGEKKNMKTVHRYLSEFVEWGSFVLLRHNLNDPAERIYELVSAAQ